MVVCGRYVVLEGGEAVGKTTQAKLLVKRLNRAGITAEQIREPGGDPAGEAIRQLVLHTKVSLLPKTEVLLFNAARVQTLDVVRRKLEAGIWCIADRSYLSTIAYQGYGRGLAIEPLRYVCLYALGDTMPDLVLLLHCDPQTALARQTKRGTSDRFEAEAAAFHSRVNKGFKLEAMAAGIPVINANGTLHQVNNQVWLHVRQLI